MYKKLLATLVIVITLPVHANYLTLVSSDGGRFAITREEGALCGSIRDLICKAELSRKKLCRMPNGDVPQPQEPLFNVTVEAFNTSQLGLVIPLLTALSWYYQGYGIFDGGIWIVNQIARKQFAQNACAGLAAGIAMRLRHSTLGPDTLKVLQTAEQSLKIPEMGIIAGQVLRELRMQEMPPVPPPRTKIPSN